VARALLFIAQRKLAEADREYGEALRLDPEHLEAHLGRGRLYAQGEKWAEAEQELQRVLKIDPDHRGARLSLALVYSRQNRTDDAIKTLEASHNVQDVTMEIARAELYLNKGDAVKAESIVAPLVRRYPGLLPGRLILGNAYLAQRKGPQAVQEFDVIAKSRGDSPQVKMLQGSSYLLVGRAADALSMFDGVRKAGAKFPALNRHTATANLHLGRDFTPPAKPSPF